MRVGQLIQFGNEKQGIQLIYVNLRLILISCVCVCVGGIILVLKGSKINEQSSPMTTYALNSFYDLSCCVCRRKNLIIIRIIALPSLDSWFLTRSDTKLALRSLKFRIGRRGKQNS